jgi:hypothetical protein
MYRSAAYLKDILKGLDPKIKANAESINAVVEGFEDKVMKEPLEFKVGDHKVRVEAKGERDNPDLYMTCDCNYWQYQGPEYYAKENKYLLGKVRGTAKPPKKRDPESTHKLCKHAYAVLRDFFGA